MASGVPDIRDAGALQEKGRAVSLTIAMLGARGKNGERFPQNCVSRRGKDNNPGTAIVTLKTSVQQQDEGIAQSVYAHLSALGRAKHF